MRLTVNDMKKVAKNILVMKVANVLDCKKKLKSAKTAEAEIALEAAESELNAAGVSFAMLGLVTHDEFKEISRTRVTKEQIAAIKTENSWMCAEAKAEGFPVYGGK